MFKLYDHFYLLTESVNLTSVARRVADRQPDNIQRAARGLRQLLVRALQPGAGLCRAARAER